MVVVTTTRVYAKDVAPTDQDLFPTRVALKVCDVSARQLDYWVQRGLVEPTLTEAEVRPNRRFSFRDLVVIRTIAQLRTAGVALQEIRLIANQLAKEDSDLADTCLVAAGGSVYRVSDTEPLEQVGRDKGQLAFTVVVLHQVKVEVEGRLTDGGFSAAS